MPADDLANPAEGSCVPSFLETLNQRVKTRLVQKAIQELQAQPLAFVSVGEWANHLGVSREHLTRSMSPWVNPHALLQATRVAITLENLTGQETLHVGKALDTMGYSSRSHAFAVFKRMTGLTPKEYWARASEGDACVHACVSRSCPLLGAMVNHHLDDFEAPYFGKKGDFKTYDPSAARSIIRKE